MAVRCVRFLWSGFLRWRRNDLYKWLDAVLHTTHPEEDTEKSWSGGEIKEDRSYVLAWNKYKGLYYQLYNYFYPRPRSRCDLFMIRTLISSSTTAILTLLVDGTNDINDTSDHTPRMRFLGSMQFTRNAFTRKTDTRKNKRRHIRSVRYVDSISPQHREIAIWVYY